MKRYWDTSALVSALHDEHVGTRAREPDQWTRPHTLAELFSTLTGGRLGFKYQPEEAAELVKEVSKPLRFVDLSPAEIHAALAGAPKRKV